jgi:hypothetical protein
MNWYAKLWYKHYMKLLNSEKLTTYGMLYSMFDIVSEAENNILCPESTVYELMAYHIEHIWELPDNNIW